MAQPNYQPFSNVGSYYVIGPQFCAPRPVEFTIKRKVLKITSGNFTIEDVYGNMMFKIKDGIQFLSDRRVLLDAAGNPLVTMRRKILGMHTRWKAFRGDSTNPRDLLFSTKQSSLIQLGTKFDVFLANNTKRSVCDFKVKGNWSERSCKIYGGDSKVVIAEMHKKLTVGSVMVGKDKFIVTVNPNIDYAFIVALIVILDATNHIES